MSLPSARHASPWETWYQGQNTPWDLGQAAPPLQDWLDAQPASVLEGKRAFVPGCGFGHDAVAFSRKGLKVLGMDLSPSAIQGARQRYEHPTLQFEPGSCLPLPEAYHQQFDLVVEHTFFCALDPSLHPAYRKMVLAALKPGGRLLGLYWQHGQNGGPPFHTPPELIEALLGDAFEGPMPQEPSTSSVAARKNQEYLVDWPRQSG